MKKLKRILTGFALVAALAAGIVVTDGKSEAQATSGSTVGTFVIKDPGTGG